MEVALGCAKVDRLAQNSLAWCGDSGVWTPDLTGLEESGGDAGCEVELPKNWSSAWVVLRLERPAVPLDRDAWKNDDLG